VTGHVPGHVPGHVIAVDFGGTKATVAAAGPDGRLLTKVRLPMHAERGAEQAVLSRAVPFPPALMLARFTQDGPLIGAAALAWESAGA
jgi:hypothetical protein